MKPKDTHSFGHEISRKNTRFFGLDQGDGELEEQKDGFYKGMMLRKKSNKEENGSSRLNYKEN